MTRPLAHINDEQLLSEVLARLGRAPAIAGDWVDAFLAGEALNTTEAATVADCTTETVRRYAGAASAAGRPIGVLFVKGVWIISLERLLNYIADTEGEPARLVARTRAENLLKTRSPPQLSSQNVAVTTRVSRGRV